MIQSVNLTDFKFTKYDYYHSTFHYQVIELTVIFVFLFKMDLSFSKKQKLKGQKLIDKLFAEGDSVSTFPLRLVYLQTGKSNQVGVSVSKKNFKNAVDRNRIKRLLREAYRCNKKMLIDNNLCGYAFMILYLSKDLPDYKMLNTKTQELLQKFINGLTDR